MNPAPLQIGDIVRIVGASDRGENRLHGEIFRIHAIADDLFTGVLPMPFYPASSLRKVRVVDEDELHVGDRVKIIGPAFACDASSLIGKSFDISQMPEFCRSRFECNSQINHYSAAGWPMFPASSLRKLAPHEIPKVEMSTEYRPKCDWCGKYLGNAAIKGQDGEQYCSIPCSTMGEDHKRLAAIELIQREHIENHADASALDRLFGCDEVDVTVGPIPELIQRTPGLWTIAISRGNMHLLNSGRDGGKLGEWVKRMMQDEP